MYWNDYVLYGWGCSVGGNVCGFGGLVMGDVVYIN